MLAGLSFYWSTTDKLEYTDWLKVNQMMGCGDMAIFLQRMIISTTKNDLPPSPPALTRIKTIFTLTSVVHVLLRIEAWIVAWPV